MIGFVYISTNLLAMALFFVTLNVNGLRDANKTASLLQWLSHLSASFVCLQETRVSSCSEAESWLSSFGFQVAASPDSLHSSGTVILYRPIFHLLNVWNDAEGRLVLCEFSFHDQIFRICSVYAPNRNPDRDDFFDFVCDSVDPSVPTISCGDFNAVFDRSVDRRGSCPSSVSRDSSNTLSSLFRDCCVLDIWRVLHPVLRGFTWDKPDGSLSSRIDLFGCPYSWASSVSSCEIHPCPLSDHSALVFCASLPDVIPPGPGRWHLNASFLSHPDFVTLISDFWATWRLCKNNFDSLLKWWDVGKGKIKGLDIRFCCQQSIDRSQSRSLLSNLAQHLKLRIDAGAVSLSDIYQNVLSRVAEIDSVSARGSQVRSRIQWVEEGESSSSFFFRLEKKHFSESWISAIKSYQNIVVSKIDEICSVWRSFYSKLFSAAETDADVASPLLENITSVLPSHQVPSCEGLLDSSEVLTALKGMYKNKSPGSDGLPAEFYLQFWDSLGSDLTEVLNEAYRTGSLTPSQRRGLISLIYKKGDRLNCKNWRPITLLL